MPTPAERFAAAKARQRFQGPVQRFAETYSFPLDDFQLRACASIAEGRGVLVAAPTGSGKTVVGEFAAQEALDAGLKCFYTTPIKALSNQKFHDLVERHGAKNVGLLTGDTAINSEAPIVVMTTEVLRNMLYTDSPILHTLGYVVMDEVHYLADRSRGAVWEEVIIHLPQRITVIALSATVSNAEEFGEWLETVRGATDVLVEEHRPVPLWQHVLVRTHLLDLFIDDDQQQVNPELVRISSSEGRRQPDTRPQRGGKRPRDDRTPMRSEVIQRLARADLLPAITFIFSRAGCEAAVRQCTTMGLRLTTPGERDQIRAYVENAVSDLPGEDLAVLGYGEWIDALERGFAAHHAGLLPRFKEVVEALFQQGLVRAVFATETLALGINMPARSVVLERLVKWNGDAHVDITPGEYTQLTGRAGRRGIDVEGHGVIVWHNELDPRALAGLASARTYPLRSSFRPSYNMAVNLVGQMGREQAREVLETSFAQFQADRAVVSLAAQARRDEEALTEYRRSMQCHLGDFEEYAGIRQRINQRERDAVREGVSKRRADTVDALEKLSEGDVVFVSTGRRSGAAVVIDPGLSPHDDPRPTVMLLDKQVRRLSIVDFPQAPAVVAQVRLPKGFAPRSAHGRKELVLRLKEAVRGITPPSRPRAGGVDEEITRLRAQMRSHPCHGCSDRETHARWAEKAWRMQSELGSLHSRIDSRTNTIARQFDRVCEILTELDYLREVDGTMVATKAGDTLKRIYSETDLLTAECLRKGIWTGLDAPALAAAVSILVYESRQREDMPVRIPGGVVRDAIDETHRIWAELEAIEKAHRVSFLREPDPGFAMVIQRWTKGATLSAVLSGSDMPPGDFVRWAKQVVDALGQIASASPDPDLSAVASSAIASIQRGVVSYATA